MPHVRVLDTATAGPLLTDIRRLVVDAFEGDFSDEDWDHTLGGLHVIASEEETLLAHAAVVPRTIWLGDDPF